MNPRRDDAASVRVLRPLQVADHTRNFMNGCVTWSSSFTAAFICMSALVVVPACSSESTDELAWLELVEEARIEVEGRELYVVEGDLHFGDLEGLREWHDAQFVAQMRPRATVVLHEEEWAVWDPETALDLTYCVSLEFEGLHARAKAEMAEATKAWEAEANVRFRYKPGWDEVCNETKPVVFAVRPVDTGGGCATFPHEPEIYGCAYPKSITMNIPAFDLHDNPSLGIFKHELGHKLGLAHEWYHPDGCQSALGRSERLTDFDSQSVMLYPRACGTDDVPYEISHLDGEGLRAIYGPPTPWRSLFVAAN